MWGSNGLGQLGNRAVDRTLHTPEKIMQGTLFKKVSLGDYHSAAIDINGDLWMWGDNRTGQIGDGTTDVCASPKIITIPDDSPKPKCTLSFNSMGGSTVASQKVISGSYATKPIDPIRKGYQFGGWYKDQACTKTWNFDTDMVSANISLYAKWIKLKYPSNPVKEADETTWDCIWFGHYFQDEAATHMNKDPIKWRVLNIDENGEALLLADKNLASIKWTIDDNNTAKTWVDSDIREWLNSDTKYIDGFKRNAFSFLEQAAIIDSAVEGDTDKVFLLSFEDATNESYGFNNRSIVNEGFKGADGKHYGDDNLKASRNSKFCDDGDNNWFLRNAKCIVQGNGDIFDWDDNAFDYNYPRKIRPAISMNLIEHEDLWSFAGTVTVDNSGETVPNEEGATKPASIVYDKSRWPMNNTSSNNVIYWGGFFSGNRKTPYITFNAYNYFIHGLKNETERNRFANFNLKKTDIDLEDYYAVTKNLTDWEGSCYGMSLLEGLHLAEKYYPNDFNTICSRLGYISSMPNTDTSVESEINLYQLMQYTDVFAERIKCYDKSLMKDDFSGLVKRAGREAINSKGSFLLTYCWDETQPDGTLMHKGHTVLCQSISECNIVGNDRKLYSYIIKTYDPNSSIYDDDWGYIYINDNKTLAYIPTLGLNSEGLDANLELYFYDKPLTQLALFTKSNTAGQNDTKFGINSLMRNLRIKNLINNKWVSFKNGVINKVSTWSASFHGFAGYVVGSNFDFHGGMYELDSTDPAGSYSIKGDDDELLDASFEYGDHTVGVFADKPGVTAVFSNNGDVEFKDVDPSGTNLGINTICNFDSTEKRANATKVCVLSNAQSNVTFKKSGEKGYELNTENNDNLKNVSIIVGTTLKSEKYDVADSKGKITVSFDGGEVIVRGDTDGDGNLDREERFPDYYPISEVSITPESTSLAVGETNTLSANIAPENASDKRLFWYSDNPMIASVSDGRITGISKGTTVIHAAAGAEGKIGSCTVTVTDTSSNDDDDIPDNVPDGIWLKGLMASYPYTGSAIKPSFEVYRGKTRLYQNTDYTVKYSRNTKPGIATVTLKMKGNYSGTKNVTFKINPVSLIADVSADAVYVAYKKNKVQKPKPEMYVNGVKVKYGKNDLSFTYPSLASPNARAYVDVGEYNIHIEPKNTQLFTEAKDVDLFIVDKPVMSSVTVKANKKSVPYNNGEAVSPSFTLKYKGLMLTEGRDYTVRYEDAHNDIGKHEVTFIGNNMDYFGEKTVTFSIIGKYDLASSKADISLDKADLNPDGSAPFTYGGAKPGAVVRYNGTRLREGKDYKITYTDNKNMGTATATIIGKGSYKGRVPKTFNIVQRDINTISPNIADMPFSEIANNYKKVSITFFDGNYKNQRLERNRDYQLYFDENCGLTPVAGTEINVLLVGLGCYKGTISSSYRIIDKNYDFRKAKVVVNSGKAYDYTGSAIKPAQADLNVTIGGSPISSENYEILGYYNNVKKGNSAYVRIQGTGKYAGVKDVKFKIGAAPIERVWSGMIMKLQTAFAW